MEADFELFEEGEVGRTQDRVHVTLGKDGRIYFSRKALEALGRPEGVALLFDKRRQVIGVKPADVGRKHAFRLRTKLNMGEGRVISAGNFCRHYGIKTPETVAFPAASVNRDGILVLDLRTVRTAGIKRRVKSKEG